MAENREASPGIPDYHRVAGHINSDIRIGGDNYVVANNNFSHQHGAGANKNPVADFWATSLLASIRLANGHYVGKSAIIP